MGDPVSIILPNIGLELPVRGAPGSGLWADTVDADLALLDEHDHTSGKGLRIVSSALNINADVTFNSLWAPTSLHRVSFASIAALSSNNKSLFVSSADNELYWRSNAGNNVKLTSGSALNVAAFAGGIGGDYVSAAAELNFDNSSPRYTLRAGGGTTWARMASGEVRIFETSSTDTVYCGIAAPAGLGASYTMTLPAALPAAQETLSINSSGTVSLDGKHGDRFMVLAGSCFRPHNNSSGTLPIYVDASGGGVGWQFGAAPNDSVRATIQLPTGTRIKTVQWFFNKRGVSTSLFMDFATIAISTGTFTSRASTTDTSSLSAIVSATNSSINYTLLSGEEFHIRVITANASLYFFGAILTYDRP